MRAVLILLVAVPTLLACEGATDTGQYFGTPPIRIAGNWSYEFLVYDVDSMANCRTNGIVQINQTVAGDQFAGGISGIFNCTLGSESTGDQTAIVAVTAGELAGVSVRFIAFGCIHLGAVAGSPPNHFTGNLFCTFPVQENGPTRPMTGTWEAIRQ